MALDGIYGNSPANLPGPVPGAPAQPAPSPLPNMSPPAGMQQLDLPGQAFTAGNVPTPAIQPPVRAPGSMVADEPNRAPSSGGDVIDFDKIALDAAEPEGVEADFHYIPDAFRKTPGSVFESKRKTISDASGSVRLMFKPDGSIMYRPLQKTKEGWKANEDSDWVQASNNDSLTQAITDKIKSVSDLVNAPEHAVGMVAGAAAFTPIPGLGPVANAVARTAFAATGAAATNAGGMGEWIARNVLPKHDQPFIDYYLQQQGKPAPWQSLLYGGAAQGAGEIFGGIFSRFAAENRSKADQIARNLPSMQAGVSDEMAADAQGVPITPGMAVGTRQGGGAVQQAEIAISQSNRTADIYHERMAQIARGLDEAFNKFKKSFSSQIDPKALSITEHSRDSIGKVSNFATRNLEAQQSALAANRAMAAPISDRQTVDPQVIAPFIEAIFSKQVPEAVVNGRLDMEILSKSLDRMGGVHSGAQTDILRKLKFWRDAAEGFSEAHGLASPLEQATGPIFPSSATRTNPNVPNQYGQPGSMNQGSQATRGSSVQGGEAQLNLSAAEVRKDTSSQIPGQTDAQKTMNPVQNPGRQGVDIGSQQNTPMSQDQMGFPGSQTRWKLPTYQEFAAMYAKQGVSIDPNELGRQYAEFCSKAAAARALLPNGVAGPISRRLPWKEFITEMNSVQSLANFNRLERNKVDKVFGEVYKHMNTLEAEITGKALEEAGNHDLANKIRADSLRFNQSREALVGMKNELSKRIDHIGRDLYKVDSYDFKMVWNVMSESEQAEAKSLLLDGILRDGVLRQVTPGNTTIPYGISAPAIYKAAFEDPSVSKNLLYAFGKKDFDQLQSLYRAANAYELQGQKMTPAQKEKFASNLANGAKRIFGLKGKVAHFVYSLVPASDGEAINFLNKKLPELIEESKVVKAKSEKWAARQEILSKTSRALPGVVHTVKLIPGVLAPFK